MVKGHMENSAKLVCLANFFLASWYSFFWVWGKNLCEWGWQSTVLTDRSELLQPVLTKKQRGMAPWRGVYRQEAEKSRVRLTLEFFCLLLFKGLCWPRSYIEALGPESPRKVDSRKGVNTPQYYLKLWVYLTLWGILFLLLVWVTFLLSAPG